LDLLVLDGLLLHAGQMEMDADVAEVFAPEIQYNMEVASLVMELR
jgi:hypothetical protein